MRYLIISDIHANLAALDAVLADAGSFDKVWHLGDLVGYGPDANEVIERLRPLPHFSLAGNHDWAALGKLDLRYFNNDARESAMWTQKSLTAENRAVYSLRAAFAPNWSKKARALGRIPLTMRSTPAGLGCTPSPSLRAGSSATPSRKKG